MFSSDIYNGLYNNPTYYEIRGGDGEVEASSENVVRGFEKREGHKKRLNSLIDDSVL